MSGNVVLGIGFDYEPLPGCSDAESHVCHQLVRTIVRSGAGVFAGAKPAALFSVDLHACERACAGCMGCGGVLGVANEALLSLAYGLRQYGFGLVVFWGAASRIMILLYSERGISALLNDSSRRDFLFARGYDTSSVAALVGTFSQRLERYYAGRRGSGADTADRPVGSSSTGSEPVFPHEIGVLFGYPLVDVEGFMHKATPTCRGPWIAYGDATDARRRFEALLSAEEGCRREFEQGVSFGELVRACAA